MMIFNSFTLTNDYNFEAQWQNGRGRRFFFPTNKTFESICLRGNFLKRSCEFFLYLKSSFCRKIIKFSFKLIYEQVN